MFTNKSRVIVGLTTYHTENLMVSLSGLARVGQGAVLIIHNDNPSVQITKQQIRQMGFRGKLHIINSQYNVGLLNSRLAILDYIRQQNISAPWFIFTDDDDVVLNLNVPRVQDTHFAVIQNAISVCRRLVDVLRAIQCPERITTDNENNFLTRPHLGLAGTLVRTSVVLRLGDVLRYAHNAISDITESLTYRAPIDSMMWSGLNIVARHDCPDVSPIYMDTTNYIITDIDNVSQKYGMSLFPTKDAQKQIVATITKYDNAIRAALADMAAAPVGPESDNQ